VQKIQEVTAAIAGGVASTHFTRPTFLMCPPEWYDVGYVINPWMAGNLHRPSRDNAFAQWRGLYAALKQIADVRLLHPKPGAPDMTFVAHSALVKHGVAAVSSFAHPERQPEEQHLREWLQDNGFIIWDTPRETAFEGEGDAQFDPTTGVLWAAHGARTCRYSHCHVADAWHTKLISLHLVDPRFYHLDTCFAPLSGGHLLYYPEAFDTESLARIHSAYPASQRITLTEREATQFGCNVVNLGKHVLMHAAQGGAAAKLQAAGYTVIELPLGEFVRGGGAAKSLALRLSDPSVMPV
jgi:N-dimethylarginine dimethylaminohydrolase